MPSKFIFHLAPGTGFLRWQNIVTKALDEAEKRNLQSIAFPALGTGQLLKTYNHNFYCINRGCIAIDYVQ